MVSQSPPAKGDQKDTCKLKFHTSLCSYQVLQKNKFIYSEIFIWSHSQQVFPASQAIVAPHIKSHRNSSDKAAADITGCCSAEETMSCSFCDKTSFHSEKSFITEFSLKLDPPKSSLRPWHGHRHRYASIGAEPQIKKKLGDRSASPPDSSLIWGSSGHSGWI